MTEQETQSTDEEFPTRGSTFVGKVVSTKMQKSATVRWEHSEKIPKYERYERRNTKVTTHVPKDLDVEEGDMVKIEETRPISKTKSSVITEIIEKGDSE